jgi:quercetin dioxygenase-like cupin family protein
MKVYDPAAVAREAVAAHQARPAMAVVHDAPDARLVVFRLAAGQAVPVHTSVSSVVLHVLSGSGLVSSADGERDVRAGMVVAYEPQEPHGMRALTEELIVLAVIAPRPASRPGPLE